MRIANQLLWAAVLAASSCLAQTGGARAITLVEGRGELLQFQRDVQKVALAEPKIADAVVLSPREVMVNAKTPGHTTLLIGRPAPTRCAMKSRSPRIIPTGTTSAS